MCLDNDDPKLCKMMLSSNKRIPTWCYEKMLEICVSVISDKTINIRNILEHPVGIEN